MRKQEILLQIHNQCEAVRKSIAVNYENHKSKELLSELVTLQILLNDFLTEHLGN